MENNHQPYVCWNRCIRPFMQHGFQSWKERGTWLRGWEYEHHRGITKDYRDFFATCTSHEPRSMCDRRGKRRNKWLICE